MDVIRISSPRATDEPFMFRHARTGVKFLSHQLTVFPIVSAAVANAIIFVVSCVCDFTQCREAPGKTCVEKCLVFIKQIETDGIWRGSKCVAPKRERKARAGRRGEGEGWGWGVGGLNTMLKKGAELVIHYITFDLSVTLSVTRLPSCFNISSRGS